MKSTQTTEKKWEVNKRQKRDYVQNRLRMITNKVQEQKPQFWNILKLWLLLLSFNWPSQFPISTSNVCLDGFSGILSLVFAIKLPQGRQEC